MGEGEIHIKPFEEENCIAVSRFLDLTAGQNYYPAALLKDHLKFSKHDNLNASFLAVKNGQIIAARFSFINPEWLEFYRQKINPQLWKLTPPSKYGYFKFLFLKKEERGQGLGPMLSERSVSVMKEAGIEGVVCHAWRESPQNSSVRYLSKMGFQEIMDHKNYWKDQDYFCEGCRKNICICSAVEMTMEFK